MDNCLTKVILYNNVFKPLLLFFTYKDYNQINSEQFLAELSKIAFHNLFYIWDVNTKLEIFKNLIKGLFYTHTSKKQLK